MSDDRQQAVTTTFLDVVEKLTFMFGEPVVVEELDRGDEEWVEARMAFTGEVNGSLAVIVPESLQPEIAANILGLDPQDLSPPEMLADALREMLNVVCGHIIMALVGSAADFRLQTPVHSRLTTVQLDALCANPDTTGFLMDDEPLLLHLEIEQD
jgi:CheY-specific phosphatase CheX